MHLARLQRSTPFRLAVAYGLLFVTSSLLVYLVTYLLLRAEIYSTLDNSVTETYSVIQSSYAPGDIEDVVQSMNSFSRLKNGDRRIFYLGSAAGKRLAGDIAKFVPATGLQTITGERLGLPGNERFRVKTGTIDGNNLLVGESLEATEDLGQIILANFAWMSVFTTLLAVFAGLFLARRAQTRIDAIAETMTEISDGNMSRRVRLTGSGDDIDLIATQINSALDRLSDLIESMRQVSADIAHDLKTPLNRLKLILEEASLREENNESVGEQLRDALAESDQINATFQALLRISQIEAGTRKTRFASVDLNQLLRTVVEIFGDVAEDNAQTLSFDAASSPDCFIEGDKELLMQLFVNLVENAMNHCPAGTAIRLSLRHTGNHCLATVADNGPGIPADEHEKVFRRLYRLDKSRNSPGHGLGLSMVKAIADLHGMAIGIEDNHPGARFVLSWERPAEQN
ncbi:HAMP domain-containing histidine kinase [Allorhizobium sp. BGMRC 0089]|uniref:sensor histidine kinase n=1 Tax=Allorhizobium sonneratiae TaxID=2934936 RepID=UPI0020332C9D|nr:HAMP domain-containing sensor histidine kinase [Allorhizobium sonneratiae]MCM2294656.1 HAMP domain-containing histidine kinase [Allorhizobium sonneratiae]